MDPFVTKIILGAAGSKVAEKYWINEIQTNASFNAFPAGINVNSSGTSSFCGLYFISGVGQYAYLSTFTSAGSLGFQKIFTPIVSGENIDIVGNHNTNIDDSGNTYIVLRKGSGFKGIGTVIKYNSSGQQQWRYSASGPFDPFYFSGIEFDPSNNLSIGVTVKPEQFVDNRPGILKLNSSTGTYSGISLVNGTNSHSTVSRRRNKNSNILVFSLGSILHLTSFDSYGNFTGAVRNLNDYGGSYRQGTSFVDNSNNIYWGHAFEGTGAGILFKFSSNLSFTWGKVFSPATNVTGISGDIDGNIYVSVPDGSGGVMLYKFTGLGSLVWSIKISNSQGSVSSNDQLVCSGESLWIALAAPSNKYALIKIPTDGSITGTFGNWTFQNTNPYTITDTGDPTGLTSVGSRSSSISPGELFEQESVGNFSINNISIS